MQVPIQVNLRLSVLVLLSIVLYTVLRKTFRDRQVETIAPLANPGVNTVRAVAWSWLAPTGVMAVFFGFGANVGRELENRFLYGPIFVNQVAAKDPKSPIVPNVSLNSTDSPKAEVLSDFNMPDWLEEGDNTTGDVRLIVLSSKLWSTEAEARQELLPRAASIVRADFDERHQSLFQRTGHRLLSDESLTQFAVKQRFLERIEQDFGTFSAPMYRLWMQVEVSPLVRTGIYPVWKSAVIGNRVIAIGTVLAFLTLAANATALFAKLKTVPNRRWTGSATIVACSVAVWIGADLFLVKLFCQ